MGRTVINETENKQTIILNDSPEGIEGGYFDQDMNWNKLGKSSVPENFIYAGKSFKAKTQRETYETIAYIPLLFIAEKEAGSGGTLVKEGEIIALIMFSANAKNVAISVVHPETFQKSEIAIVNNAGNYNTAFTDFTMYLESGIDPAFKDIFDNAFEEV